MEEAAAYQRLLQEFSLTQEEIAVAMGKDRATIANTLRLLKLAPEVREEVSQGRLTLGHARALLALESAKAQVTVAQQVITQGLSVRRVEGLIKALLSGEGAVARPKKNNRDPHLVAAEQKLQRALATNVQIAHKGSRGWVRIAYYSLKDLDKLINRLAGSS